MAPPPLLYAYHTLGVFRHHLWCLSTTPQCGIPTFTVGTCSHDVKIKTVAPAQKNTIENKHDDDDVDNDVNYDDYDDDDNYNDDNYNDDSNDDEDNDADEVIMMIIIMVMR